MATANDIINRAGRRSRILAEEESFGAAQAVYALQLLNDMLHNFGPRGIAYAHTTLAAGDTVNVPDELIRPLVLLFTEEICLDFGRPMDAALLDAIEGARNEFQAAYHLQEPAVSEPMLSSRGLGSYNIRTDR